MRVKEQVHLKNALHNLASTSGASLEYCQGLTVGVVSSLMAMGFSYKDAIAQVAINMPEDRHNPRYAVPESWQQDLIAARLAAGHK